MKWISLKDFCINVGNLFFVDSLLKRHNSKDCNTK